MGLPVRAGPSVYVGETGGRRMLKSLLGAAVLALGSYGPAMAQERIRISSDWGNVTAELINNEQLDR